MPRASHPSYSHSRHLIAVVLALLLALPGIQSSAAGAAGANVPPAVGGQAPEFALNDLNGTEVSLKALTAKGPVVLLVLRGYPGYQCPICTRQVGEFFARAADFGERGARVVMIYPGPAEGLGEHAAEFVAGKALPERFVFLTDPGYTFTNGYGLRWDAPGETAYPAAFVVDGSGKVRFAKVSRTHGGRAGAAELLEALDKAAPVEGR